MIAAQQPDMAEWLSDACRTRGCATVWLRPGQPMHAAGAVAGLFDMPGAGDEAFEQLRTFVAAIAPARVAALMNFPRVEDRDRARSAGAAAVLSKPLQVDDLVSSILD